MWSRLHVRLGNPSHVTSPTWVPHLHVNRPVFCTVPPGKWWLRLSGACFTFGSSHQKLRPKKESRHLRDYFWVVPGFSWFFFAKEIKSKPRSGDNESRKRPGERENPLFLSLSSSLSRLVVAASWLALDLFREGKSRKTSGTRVAKLLLWKWFFNLM